MTSTSRGFTLIEMLVVLVVTGLLAGVAVPRLYDISRRFEIALQRDNLVLAIGNLGYQAYQAGRPLTLSSDPKTPSPDASPPLVVLGLPAGWTMETPAPIVYSFNGLCSGGKVTLHGPDGYSEQLVLTPPLCKPNAATHSPPK